MNYLTSRVVGAAAAILTIHLATRGYAQDGERGKAAKGETAEAVQPPKIFGDWAGVSYEYNGEPMRKFAHREGASLTLRENRYSYSFRIPAQEGKEGNGDIADGRLIFDMTKDPMEMRYREDLAKPESKLKAVFRLKGDDLLWSMVQDGAPPRLKTEKGDLSVVILFRRGGVGAHPYTDAVHGRAPPVHVAMRDSQIAALTAQNTKLMDMLNNQLAENKALREENKKLLDDLSKLKQDHVEHH